MEGIDRMSIQSEATIGCEVRHGCTNRKTLAHQPAAPWAVPACGNAPERTVGRPWSSSAYDETEVLDRWERVVEVMEEPLPLLVPRRLPKSLRVVFETLP